jgi:hypothetical protein
MIVTKRSEERRWRGMKNSRDVCYSLILLRIEEPGPKRPGYTEGPPLPGFGSAAAVDQRFFCSPEGAAHLNSPVL